MLTQLTIANFAIVRYQELEFQPGMTCITGETGAGKSIALDALNLCLGGRAESRIVRKGAPRAELCAHFELSEHPQAQLWLEEQQLLDGKECILRRTITAEGRSRAYINGNMVPLSQLKALGDKLINIHGQHAHHQLLRSDQQRNIIDAFAEHPTLLEKTRNCAIQYQQLTQQLQELKQQQEKRHARQQLLQYQTEELNELALAEGEYLELEQQHQQLSHFSQLQQTSYECLERLGGDTSENVISLLQGIVSPLEEIKELDQQLANPLQLVQEALISLEESRDELQHYQQHLEFDPEQFEQIEYRMTRVLNLARKHQVSPEQLAAHHRSLLDELEQLEGNDQQQLELKEEIASVEQCYLEIANKLSASRNKAAKRLSRDIEKGIHELNMEKGRFSIEIQPKAKAAPSVDGIDDVAFLVSLNPGQDLYPLSQVASGGELSRISLVIETIIAKKMATPTLIFDEVDVGISGPTAARVGQQLRQLASATQVLVVTHLPQVAGQGHQHLFVSKQNDGDTTESTMEHLDPNRRIEELARLLGGDQITDATLANARQLLFDEAC
ncbi:DNA repair protein RecN [Dongshaea marina]|uniref:DNA repair protein RecN n=1 Tax=Dongshaea marina TaxID=2047966 RepID=UPI000D3EA447|nr:DNA repair protein RecN [Dongshaea marina]